MRRSSLLAVASLGLLLAGCASSGWHTYAQAPPAPKPIQTAAATGPNRMICHDTAPTGSLLPTRECHTAAEWDRLRMSGMDNLNLDAARSMPTTDPGSATGR
jgi:hypothetical protein